MNNTKKLIISALLIAIGVVTAHLISIPVGVARAFPIQHTINILSAILLGPLYAVLNAFIISMLRNILGLGSLLAFPGSIIGALTAGMLYKVSKNKLAALGGEVFGTGIIGGILAFPVAKFMLGSGATAFAFVIPFLASSLVGAIIGYLIIKTNIFSRI